jgi:prepilin peptidase CpaA
MIQIPQIASWICVAVLIEAAIIDGLKFKVPNWLTYHFMLGGLIYSYWLQGSSGLATSAAGLGVGLILLLPLYAIGGMGAGDVKLLAGLGAWIGPLPIFWAFACSAIVGGLIAIAMMARSGRMFHHVGQIQSIGSEILTVRDPVALSKTAAERKPSMLLLPYGVPIAIGSIGYFVWSGMLF